jgi:Reverse transcriptase (RNA-dependent DNA polymerase)
MTPRWSSKFELKPGRWVFVPTPAAVAEGQVIKAAIEDRWSPPDNYFHFRAGGHVAALRSHLDHSHFLRLDIQDFFGSVNATRVTRCLKPIFGYAVARHWAKASTVPHPTEDKRSVVPYGFVQSQIIAALCLSESALGVCLDKLSRLDDVALSVYVDDVIISSNDADLSQSLLVGVKTAAERARFTFKTAQGPATQVTAFNIELSSKSLLIEGSRLRQFSEALANATSEAQRSGILSYVASVNESQLSAL